MSKAKPGYVGRYTVNEFAMAEQKCLAEHGDEYSRSTLHQIVNYVARHDWPAQRGETFAALYQGESMINQTPAILQAAVNILRVYDRAQEYLDAAHHGDSYKRAWPQKYTVDGVDFDVAAILNPEPKYLVRVSGPGITADTEISFSEL